MKRLLSLLLTMMLCAAVLAGCSDKADENTAEDVTVEEQTIFDDQGIKAVVKGYGTPENEITPYERELLIDVTNSTDKAVTFGLDRCSINGYMIHSNYSYTIAAGKTETFPALFDEAELEASGVTTIADYEFCIVVEDEETFETLVESDPISVKTSAYDGFDYQYDESGTVMYDADGVKIIAQDLVEDDFFGPGVYFYAANDTDRSISVSIASCSVNGTEIYETYFGADLLAGKRSVTMLSIGEEQRPEKIESMTLSFSIFDWDTDELIIEETEPVTVTF